MQKPCRKCLLEDMEWDEFFANLKSYIENYPQEKRADEITYHNRLEICKKCDSLTNGMCALCGCYVELRAVKKDMYCPFVPSKW